MEISKSELFHILHDGTLGCTHSFPAKEMNNDKRLEALKSKAIRKNSAVLPRSKRLTDISVYNAHCLVVGRAIPRLAKEA